MYPHHGEDVETLLRRADVAMYSAKEEKAGYVFYDGSRSESDPARLTLVSDCARQLPFGLAGRIRDLTSLSLRHVAGHGRSPLRRFRFIRFGEATQI